MTLTYVTQTYELTDLQVEQAIGFHGQNKRLHLSQIAAQQQRPVVLVLNDLQRAIWAQKALLVDVQM